MASVYANHNRKTCIVYAEIDGLVLAVSMQSPELGLLEMGAAQFHSQYAQVESCDGKRAAQQYLDGLIPYNLEVQSILENITMATKKAAPKAEAAVVEKVIKGKGKNGDVKVTKAKEDKAAKFFAEQEAKVAEKAPKAAKAEKAPKEPKEKAERAPKVDLSSKKIMLLPAAEGKRFQEGSVRSQCFAKIKDGMTVKAYLAACAKIGVDEAAATGCLKKLTEATQKTQPAELVD